MGDLIYKTNSFLTKSEELVKRYLDYIDVSVKTQETYKNGLKSFMLFLKQNGINEPKREDIISFREYLKETHSLSTTNTYMIGLRNFFKWLSYEKIYDNISENVKGVQVSDHHIRQPLTIEQVNLIMNSFENNREKMIFNLAVSLGLRANEIVNIRLSDFKKVDGEMCLYILGKARDGKVDYVPINDILLEEIKNYIIEYNIHDYLFTSLRNNKGGKLTTKTIRKIVKQMFNRVGINGDEYSLHSLRHTFATFNITNGANIREVSKALRHKSLRTTEIYLHDIDMKNNKCFEINKILIGNRS